MKSFAFNADSIEDTEHFGHALAEALSAGTVVALNGTLGAGKTRLVQAVAAALGVAEGVVVSPTFVLVQQYRGERAIYHFDAYRVADDDEFIELGASEYFESDGICFVEWANRVDRCLPTSHLVCEIEVTGDTSRRFTLSAEGEQYASTVDQIRERLESPWSSSEAS